MWGLDLFGWVGGSGIDPSTAISGTGTANYIAKFTSAQVIGNSLAFDNGTSIGVGTATPSAYSILDLTSTSQGFLAPRMTTAQRNAIASPVDGLLIYNTSTKFFNYYNPTAGVWIQVDTSTGGDVSGSGTTGNIPVWTDGPNSVLGDSVITQSAPTGLQFSPTAASSAGVTTFTFTQPANTNQSGDSEIPGTLWNTGSRQWASANITNQREFYLTAPTYSSVAVGTTITNAYTFYVEQPVASGITITNKFAAGFSGNIAASKAYLGGLATTPTALLHLAAGTATASTAPLKFTSGTSLTSAEAGAMEFTTDDLFFTITTGAARKRLVMAEPVGGLTSTRVPFATTNGRLTDSANMTYSGTRLSPNYVTLAAGTSSAGTAPLLFTTGTNLTSPEAGAMEFSSSVLYFTPSATRMQVALVSGGGSLTAGRVVYVAAGGVLTDSANMTYSGTRLSPNYVTLAAGTATAATAPLKFTSGTLLSSPEAGAIEFLTDKYYATITTGPARAEITLNDIALTSGRVPFVTTNGRLTDNSGFKYDGTNLMVGTGTAAFSDQFQINFNTNARVGINITNQSTGASSYTSLIMGESSSNYIQIFKNSSGATGNLGGTSIPNANLSGFDTQTGNYFTRSTVIYGIIGSTGTNIGTRLSAAGLRIDAISNLTTDATAYLTIKGGTATASTAPLKFTSGTNLTTPEAGATEYDGTEVYFTNSTAVRGTKQVNRSIVSNAASLTLALTYTAYIFTGTTTTWTLPAVSGSTNHMFFIKNRGSGDITLNSDSGNTLYTTAATNTYAITPGSAIILYSDGTYFLVE